MLDSLQRPEVILTHESDLDGLVAGVLLQRLARKLFDCDIRIEACNYNYWKQRELRERAAWVTDLSFEARLDRPNWVVIDHHVTDTVPKHAYWSMISKNRPGCCATRFAASTNSIPPSWIVWFISATWPICSWKMTRISCWPAITRTW